MLHTFLLLLFLLMFSTNRVKAQSGTVSVGPLLTCGLTTFTCPGVSGCCTIGGCCGKGCCANGYTCINEGTSTQACCPTSDPTKCGTVASPSTSPSGGHTCTSIQVCPASNGNPGWTCLLGQTCALTYRQCYPCPYIGGSGSSSSVSFAGSSPTTSSISRSSSSISSIRGSTSSTSSVLQSTSSSARSSSSSVSTPRPSPTPASGSTTSFGYRSGEMSMGLYWLVAISLGSVFAIVLLCT